MIKLGHRPGPGHRPQARRWQFVTSCSSFDRQPHRGAEQCDRNNARDRHRHHRLGDAWPSNTPGTIIAPISAAVRRSTVPIARLPAVAVTAWGVGQLAKRDRPQDRHTAPQQHRYQHHRTTRAGQCGGKTCCRSTAIAVLAAAVFSQWLPDPATAAASRCRQNRGKPGDHQMLGQSPASAFPTEPPERSPPQPATTAPTGQPCSAEARPNHTRATSGRQTRHVIGRARTVSRNLHEPRSQQDAADTMLPIGRQPAARR